LYKSIDKYPQLYKTYTNLQTYTKHNNTLQHFAQVWNPLQHFTQLVHKQQNKHKKSWQPTAHPSEKILFECLNSRKKSFGEADDTLISFGWNSIELLSLANELNLKGVFVPLASFIQNPTIAFILNAEKAQRIIDSPENPTAEDFDIDDILSVLNKELN
jgi:aryl carrier-like protein